MIFVQMNGHSPDFAYAFAETLLVVFQRELDALRDEERAVRDSAFSAALAEYESDVTRARDAVITYQSQTGLMSREQFDELVRETEALNRRLGVHIETAEGLEARSDRLAELIGLNPYIAAAILILRGDPEFELLRGALAEAASSIAGYRGIYGSNHPLMREAVDTHSGLLAEMMRRGEALLGVERYQALRLADINLDDERAAMLRQMVELSAEAAGEHAAAQSLGTLIRANRARLNSLSPLVAELEARLRTHRVAETVFSSAVARLSTAQADLFTSYPLIQVLEAPARPQAPSSPSLKIAVGAAMAGFMLFLMGVLMLWLRLPLIRMLWKIA